MAVSNLTIRPMNSSEIDLAIAWAADEGWNPGNWDAECFYQTDRQGFLIGELNGEPVGCISAVAYDRNFGFIGFYIVKPEYRGRGYGMQLWTEAMSYLGSERNIGLDVVIAQQENYKKSGFQTAYNHIRHEGVNCGTLSPGIVELSTVPFRAASPPGRRQGRVVQINQKRYVYLYLTVDNGLSCDIIRNRHEIFTSVSIKPMPA